jgi:hypothetical protein
MALDYFDFLRLHFPPPVGLGPAASGKQKSLPFGRVEVSKKFYAVFPNEKPGFLVEVILVDLVWEK